MLVLAPVASGHDTRWTWGAGAAEEELEIGYSVVDAELLAVAREDLALAQRIGSPTAIENAARVVKIVKQGLAVDLARCIGKGTRYKGALYKHFRCRLFLSDVLGNSGRADGVLHVTGQARFVFQRTSFASAS